MTQRVTISCITPTYNRVLSLKNAIESCISQTYKHWEMIIVDDGSIDRTKEMVIEFTKIDARIKYYKNPMKGGSCARNYGIKQANGEWIAFLDDDTENLSHRFATQLKAAQLSRTDFIIFLS